MNQLLGIAGVVSALAIAAFSNQAGAVDWHEELKKHEGETLRVQLIQDPFIDALKKISPKFTRSPAPKSR